MSTFDWGDTPKHERNWCDPDWSPAERIERLTEFRNELLSDFPGYADSINDIDVTSEFAAIGLVVLSGTLSGKGVSVEISDTDDTGRTETLGHQIEYDATGELVTVVYTETPDGKLSDSHAEVVSGVLMPEDIDDQLRDITD